MQSTKPRPRLAHCYITLTLNAFLQMLKKFKHFQKSLTSFKNLHIFFLKCRDLLRNLLSTQGMCLGVHLTLPKPYFEVRHTRSHQGKGIITNYFKYLELKSLIHYIRKGPTFLNKKLISTSHSFCHCTSKKTANHVNHKDIRVGCDIGHGEKKRQTVYSQISVHKRMFNGY